MPASLRPGLTGYSCARAFVAWNLAVVAIFFVLQYYGLLPAAPAEIGATGEAANTAAVQMRTYFRDVAGRIPKDPFFLIPMCLVLVGSIGYALALVVAMRAISAGFASDRGRPSIVGRWIGHLVGLPAISGGNAIARLASRGASYATAPLRDAVTLFPAVGFLGTVVGVSIALGGLDAVIKTRETSKLMQGLLTAFDTTFLGLLAALVLTVALFAIDSATAQITALIEDLPQE